MRKSVTAATIAARLGLDLPILSGPLTVRRFENRIEDGFSLIRSDTSPPVEVGVIHDGSDRGMSEADNYRRLVKLAPVMLALLVEALGAWEEQFDDSDDIDLSVPGSDLIDWFAQWRQRVRGELAAVAGSP